MDKWERRVCTLYTGIGLIDGGGGHLQGNPHWDENPKYVHFEITKHKKNSAILKIFESKISLLNPF